MARILVRDTARISAVGENLGSRYTQNLGRWRKSWPLAAGTLAQDKALSGYVVRKFYFFCKCGRLLSGNLRGSHDGESAFKNMTHFIMSPQVRPPDRPSDRPTVRPTDRPSDRPTVRPTVRPSARPSVRPSDRPSVRPSVRPTDRPTDRPSDRPSLDKVYIKFRQSLYQV